MALHRTALRLAAIEALAPHACHVLQAAGEPAPWPTLAADAVLDTALTAAFEGWDGKPRPFILVYVEDAKREPYSGASIAADARETVTLAIEVVVPERIYDAETRQDVAIPVVTDAATEALLDVIEQQVDQALQHARADGMLWHVIADMMKTESVPQRDPDLAVRFAARRIEYALHLYQSQPLPLTGTGLDRLPGPLRAVAAGLAEGSAGRALAEQIASWLITPPAFAPLQTIRIAASLAREAGDPAPPAFADGEGGDKQAAVEFP